MFVQILPLFSHKRMKVRVILIRCIVIFPYWNILLIMNSCSTRRVLMSTHFHLEVSQEIFQIRSLEKLVKRLK